MSDSDTPSAREFSSLSLPPPVAEAIARRGYATATEVQAAVLDPELRGRDLLVSAQTGSGKTLAFAALVAEALLGPEAAGAARPSAAPAALVVAPTRELAAQVARELAWLYEDARLRAHAFTGGTDVRGDLRALRAGVDVAVGTPGRLVDLVERKSLDLSAVRALVLDEADEMLDLGFKDDLETLLKATPEDRRTLLFSATLPSEVARLARSYQKDAARIDVRSRGTDGHADIEYVAHLVRPDDRFAALVNVLVAAGRGKAIIFCRTREAVGRVHQRLTDHGFRAVLMAGDRAQGDRERALASLRDGAARVLVATNVAARGLDLPDVEIVVHADLPENAEALTHRSGRTGRAGRKGTSVVLAEPAERRKAERLLAYARVRARWTAAPTEAEARGIAYRLWAQELLEEAKGSRPGAPGDGAADALRGLADELGAALPERVLLHVLLARAVAGLPAALPLAPLDPASSDRRRPGARGRDAFGGPEDDGDGHPRRGWTRSVLFRISAGKETGAEPGWLLPLLCRRGGVTRHEIGAIRIGRGSSTFEIAAEAAEAFGRAAARPDPRAPELRIEPLGDPAAHERARPDGDGPKRTLRGPRGAEGEAPARPRRAAARRDEGGGGEARAPRARAKAAAAAEEGAQTSPARPPSEVTAATNGEKPRASSVAEPAEGGAEAHEAGRDQEASAPEVAVAPPATEPDAREAEAVPTPRTKKTPARAATSDEHPPAPKGDESERAYAPRAKSYGTGERPLASRTKPRPSEDRAYVPRAKASGEDQERGGGGRTYAPRAKPSFGGGDRPYAPRAKAPYDGDRPPRAKPAFGGGERAYAPRAKPAFDEGGDRPYAPRAKAPYDGDRPPRAKAPYDGDRPPRAKPAFGGGDRPYAPRAKPPFGGGDRPYASRSKPSFGGDGDRPYASRAKAPYDGDRPPRAKPAFGGGDRAYAPRGKPFGAGAKPYGKATKPYGAKGGAAPGGRPKPSGPRSRPPRSE